MPITRKEKAIFALITVIITVHAYIFYSIYVINGDTLTEYASTVGEPVSNVFAAIERIGGINVFGTPVPIWGVVLIEFAFAYSLELLMGSPCSLKLALRCFDPKTMHPVLFETAIICATVGLMCPAMSFIAAFLYYPYAQGFDIWILLANWGQLVCFNFPFAFFSQLFFIQPLVRTIFRHLVAARRPQAAPVPAK